MSDKPQFVERVTFDQDGISSVINELGPREDKKAAHSQRSIDDPEGASFDQDHVTFSNLDNMKMLRERYPDRYSKEMTDSLVKPSWARDDSWISDTFAAQTFKGFSDNDYIESVKKHFEEDMLGIPKEFFEIKEGREWALKMINRSHAHRVVNEWLREQLKLEKPAVQIEQTYIGNTAGFS